MRIDGNVCFTFLNFKEDRAKTIAVSLVALSAITLLLLAGLHANNILKFKGVVLSEIAISTTLLFASFLLCKSTSATNAQPNDTTLQLALLENEQTVGMPAKPTLMSTQNELSHNVTTQLASTKSSWKEEGDSFDAAMNKLKKTKKYFSIVEPCAYQMDYITLLEKAVYLGYKMKEGEFQTLKEKTAEEKQLLFQYLEEFIKVFHRLIIKPDIAMFWGTQITQEDYHFNVVLVATPEKVKFENRALLCHIMIAHLVNTYPSINFGYCSDRLGYHNTGFQIYDKNWQERINSLRDEN